MLERDTREPVEGQLDTTPPWISLYHISQSTFNPDSTHLIRRYSRYKYGSPEDAVAFGNELATVIVEDYGVAIAQSPEEWIIVTPPYSRIPPAVYSVGRVELELILGFHQ